MKNKIRRKEGDQMPNFTWGKSSPQSMRVRKTATKEVKKRTTEIYKQAEQDIASNYHLIWILALRDVCGFGEKRITRVLDKVMSIAEALGDGEITFEDIRKTIAEETGVQV